jgi:hypothetical protein
MPSANCCGEVATIAGNWRRKAGHGARGAYDRAAHGCGLEQLVLDAATRDKRQDRDRRSTDRGAEIGQVRHHAQTRLTVERGHLGWRIRAQDGARRVGLTRDDDRPHASHEPAQSLEVRSEAEPSPEDDRVRLRLDRQRPERIDVDAIRDDVDVPASGHQPHGASLGCRHDPDTVHERAVRPLVETLDGRGFQVRGCLAGRRGNLRQVMPDPLVGRVPDAHGRARRRQVRQDLETHHHEHVRLPVVHDRADRFDACALDSPVPTVAFLQGGQRHVGCTRRVRVRERPCGGQRQPVCRRCGRRHIRGECHLVAERGERLHHAEAVHVVPVGPWPAQFRLDEEESHVTVQAAEVSGR